MTIHAGLAHREATARPSDALAPTCRGEDEAIDLLLGEAPVPLSRAIALLVK
ncbi:hypothetical protein [Bradyrhizobium iriomotense]|uniref:Uncharacterized protein n=1 Tax=Bradyrhizobium iriomotense TaxID=441950 RepID=A0ABQ6B1S2_9BRAD|nr:hypothetical protein [Bradyrhizobium iriomotense]GLR86057.1 hypothetical protein GCM10007857_27680 [Bradyrhizobium iriomotense]